MTRKSGPRADDAEDATKTTVQTATVRHASWDGLEAIEKDDCDQILSWITERCGSELVGYVRTLLGRRRDQGHLDSILSDTLFRSVKRISEGLHTDPDKLMSRPLGALVWTLVKRAFIDWLRQESRWRTHHQPLTDAVAESAVGLDGGRHGPRGSVRRHNGEEMVKPWEDEPSDPEATSHWEQFEHDLDNIYTALGFNQHERDVYTAYTMLKREFEDKGEKLSKKGYLDLLVQKVTAITGQQKTLPYVKRWKSKGKAKLKEYLDRQARLLSRDKPGGFDGCERSISDPERPPHRYV